MEVLLNTSGDSTILYLKKAPHIAPTPRRKYSKPFIVENSVINEIMNVIIIIKWIKLCSKLNL